MSDNVLKFVLQTLERIRSEIGSHYIWVQVDETTDAEGRYIANVIVGAMRQDEFSTPHLLVCRELQSTNHGTISRLVNEAMSVLWPDKVHHDRLLLFLSDAAPYMIKVGKALEVFYPSLLHVTCLAHALHRVAECIRDAASITNCLVSSVRKIFVKAPTRVQLYKEKTPDIPLPPEPVLTRWGTWLKAALFYAEHLDDIQNIVMCLDASEAKAIEKAQHVMQDPSLRAQLTYLKGHFSELESSITALEKRDLPLGASLDIISRVNESLALAPGEIGRKAQAKLDTVLKTNPGFATLKGISQSLHGEVPNDQVNLSPAICALFKNAPTTSVEVERSFSTYKNILADNRRRLTVKSIEQLIVSHCNA